MTKGLDVADKPWKREERRVAGLINGTRYVANSDGRVDAEGPQIVAQGKHVRRLSLAKLEALALEADRLGANRGKAGLVVTRRRAGQGHPTPRLVETTASAWWSLSLGKRQDGDTP